MPQFARQHLHCADVTEGGFRGEAGVEAEDDDAGVAEEAAHDDQVVQVGGGHFDLSEYNE